MTDNVIHADFGKASTQNLMNELRSVIAKPDYDHVMVCEVIGILNMLSYEMDRKNK